MNVPDHLEFRHLKYIIAVAETGSFTAAALKLHVAQSAISRQIGEVEDIYNIQIFQRTEAKGRAKLHRIAKLTQAGESLLRFAYELLETRLEVIESVRAMQHSAMGPFRLGFSQFVEHNLLLTVHRSYRDIFPGGKIEPASGDTEVLIDRLRASELDASLVTLPVNSDGVVVQPIMHENLAVCIRHDDPLAQYEFLAPEVLSRKLGIFSDPRHHPRAHARLVEMLEEQGIVPSISSPNFNARQVQWMVKEGICLALVREHEPLDEGLTTRPIRDVKWTVDSAIVYCPNQNKAVLPLLLRELERKFPVVSLPKPPLSGSLLKPAQGALPFEPVLFKSDCRDR